MASGEAVRIGLRHVRGVTPIEVGTGVVASPGGSLLDSVRDRSVFVITSRTIFDLHGHRLSALAAAASEWRIFDVPDGEAAKTLDVASSLWRAMLREGGKRDSVVVAFGGGSVGDLAGFVAAGFLRGVDLVLLPSTLLAQVDAAIGGKTAVNLPEAKNSVGAFHHPRAVACDTELIATLDEDELRSGLFEVVKIGAIRASTILDRVEGRLSELLQGDAAALAPVVADAVAAKAEIVEADPEEGDQRRLLNFGHTLGHALESQLGYGIRHGEAVGYGMLFALQLAEERGLASSAARRVEELIGRIGLPALPALDSEDLLQRMGRDKKARRTGLAWVYPSELGRGTIDESIEPAEFERALQTFLAGLSRGSSFSP